MTIADDTDTLEMLYLALICRVAEPRAVFEIGTFEGRTANVMALHTSPDCRIHTLDLPPDATETRLPVSDGDMPWLKRGHSTHGRRLGTLPDPADNERIEFLHGDSATFDYTPYQGTIDLVFVDGAHSYDYVMSDVRNALTMLAPRGLILMHDLLAHVGVTMAATVLRQEHEIIHVAQTSFAVLFPSERQGQGTPPRG
jgi:predicted O-methyltransferase YrrM